MSKLLTVFGATGQQGGSIISYVLQHAQLSKAYRFRGITRDSSKPSALALKDRGVEVLEANLDDPSSLAKAVAGSYVVFGVTNFWEQISKDVEIAQGKAMADACVAAKVDFLIWSSLPNITKLSEGKITGVLHFDSKAIVEEYIKTLPIKSAFYLAGWYMQNHLQAFPPQILDDGRIMFSHTWAPTTRVPMIDIMDTGKFLAPILLDPEKYNGKSFTCAQAFYTPVQLAEGWSKVLGKKITYRKVSTEIAHVNLPEGMQEELAGSDGLLDKLAYYGPTGEEDLKWTLAQMDGRDRLVTWEDFVRANEAYYLACCMRSSSS